MVVTEAKMQKALEIDYLRFHENGLGSQIASLLS
jgi:hypothetical protein